MFWGDGSWVFDTLEDKRYDIEKDYIEPPKNIQFIIKVIQHLSPACINEAAKNMRQAELSAHAEWGANSELCWDELQFIKPGSWHEL